LRSPEGPVRAQLVAAGADAAEERAAAQAVGDVVHRRGGDGQHAALRVEAVLARAEGLWASVNVMQTRPRSLVALRASTRPRPCSFARCSTS
jgi:hypothetical protein